MAFTEHIPFHTLPTVYTCSACTITSASVLYYDSCGTAKTLYQGHRSYYYVALVARRIDFLLQIGTCTAYVYM